MTGRGESKGQAVADTVAEELVRRAAEGDAAARRRLVDATLDDLWARAMHLVRREDDADEIVQETYARALAHLADWMPRGRFEGYLARIATNLVLERWRRARPAVPLDPDFASPAALEPWQHLADEEEDRRRLAAIWEAVRQLAPQPRAALLLYHAEGESCDAIAAILDVPVGTVKSWLHRARLDVRRGAEALLRGRTAVSQSQIGDQP
jgi:RNA polymerase sigma-70 factor (ECF subfamily)